MPKKIKLLKVTNLMIDSKGRVRIRKMPKNNADDCLSCVYLSKSGQVCTLPVKVEYKKGHCIYRKLRAKSVKP